MIGVVPFNKLNNNNTAWGETLFTMLNATSYWGEEEKKSVLGYY